MLCNLLLNFGDKKMTNENQQQKSRVDLIEGAAADIQYQAEQLLKMPLPTHQRFILVLCKNAAQKITNLIAELK